MADYQDFEVKATNSTSLLPKISGKYYYIVGATSSHAAPSGVTDGTAEIFGLLGTTVSIPGQGIPCEQFKVTASTTWAFYYIK